MLFIGGFGAMMPFLIKPYGILLLPIIAPIFNLLSVPFFRLIGYYKYLNPYVLSTVQTDKEYDLHNVFTFDYLVNFKWADRGKKVQKTLLGHYFKALLTIIEHIETGQLPPEVKIVGHSYFFSDRTAEKLGFTISKMPKFWKVKRAEIIGSDLVKKKEYLEGLVKKLL